VRAGMRIITRKFLEEAKKTYPKARASLDHWHRITRASKWQNLAQTREIFGHADQVTVRSNRTVTVFNITNDFRLITAIHYNRQEIFTMRFLTHAEYSKNKWKSSL
jgi:mRNA interferase HigB